MYNIEVNSELRIVGSNPEFADWGNPNGDIIRAVYFVTATTPEGRIYRHFFESEDLGQIERLAEAVRITTDWKPTPGRWRIERSVYGSQAYIEDGEEKKWRDVELSVG